jgi:single-strand DNA-binding protein
MNKGTLIGFISSDIKSETLNLKSGETMKKVGFNIACNRKSKDKSADFPRVVAFGKTADVIEQYLGKGRGVIAQFHVQTSKYTNKEGKTIYQTDLVCDEIEFPPVRKDEESTPVADSNGNMSPNNDTHSQSAPDDSFMNIPDDIEDSLPFR